MSCCIKKQILQTRPIKRINRVQFPVQNDAFLTISFAAFACAVVDPDAIKVHLVHISLASAARLAGELQTLQE